MKCTVCYNGMTYLAPDLVMSGYPDPSAYICPVCDTQYTSSGMTTKKYEENLANKQAKIDKDPMRKYRAIVNRSYYKL